MAFEVKGDCFEVCLVEDLLVLGGAEEERTAVEVVGFAGYALGVVVDGGDEAVAEELARIAGDAEGVFDVACGFRQVRGFEVKTDGDALVGGFVGSEAEFVGQVNVTVNAVGPVPSPDLILLLGRDRPHFDQTMETRTVFSVQITSISSKLRKETCTGESGICGYKHTGLDDQL